MTNSPETVGHNGSEPTPEGSEDAIALDFVCEHVNDVRHVAEMGKWYRWDSCRWAVDETIVVNSLIRPYARHAALLHRSEGQQRRLASAATVGGVERLARSDQRIAARVIDFDTDLFAINTPLGIVDLRTGAMRACDPAALCSKITAVGPALPGTPAPLWTKFLNNITKDDDNLIAFYKRMFGYMLTGSVSEHALFFAYGVGFNGKGVFFNTLRHAMHDYATAAPPELFLASRTERHPTELARLRGARLVVASEINEGQQWNEARIKWLTGGDPIVAHFMRKDDFEFMPQFKAAILGNHRPGLRNVGVAIKERVKMMPFERVFAPPDLDPDLSEKLKAEWPQILRWGIEGCLEWQRDGLLAPARVIEATSSYLDEQDVLTQWIDECCVREAAAFTSSTTLFGSWRAWREGRSEPSGSQKAFVGKLKDRGFVHKATSAANGFKGLKMPEPTRASSSESYENEEPVGA